MMAKAVVASGPGPGSACDSTDLYYNSSRNGVRREDTASPTSSL